MRALTVTVVVLLLLPLCPSFVQPCSTFFLVHDGHLIFGKNYDWTVDDGILLVNKRGMSKVAMTETNPVRWTSKYGSVTFNQYGRELPSGGMNEAGLVVELMWLDTTEYPARDNRPAIGNMQWIQYQLDNAATVNEVVASDTEMRVARSGSSKIHYLVADKTGRCASIEFIDGRMVYRDTDSMAATVLTNHTYDESSDFLAQYEGFGGNEPLRYDRSSLGRFVGTAARLQRYDGADDPVDYAFDTLHQVDQGDATKWSIVYDVVVGIVNFRTEREYDRKHLALADVDFDCATAVKLLDLNTPAAGNIVEAMTDYTTKANRGLIGASFGQTRFLKKVPASALDYLSRYPESTTCGREIGAR